MLSRGGRIQLVELRFNYKTHSHRTSHQEVTACWAKRVVVDAGTRGGPDFKWASFTRSEYDRLAGKGRVDRWAVECVGSEIVYGGDYSLTRTATDAPCQWAPARVRLSFAHEQGGGDRICKSI